MLFGQWEDDHDRQRKHLKTKMYKEMLDNQILINERYKREKRANNDHDDTHQTEKKFPLKSQFKKNNDYNTQLDLTLSNIKTKSNQINLPSIKDKNTYYQGSSKFLKVEEPPKPASQSPFKTELIEEDDEDLDQYNSTCEKIIRELKSINKQTPKMKYRRKLYEYSDLAPNRKRYEKIKIEELKKSQVELYNNYDYAKPTIKQESPKNVYTPYANLSVKTKIASDDRIPSFSMVGSSKEHQPETAKPKPQKLIFNQAKLKKQERPINEFEEDQRPQIQTKPYKMMTEPSEPTNSMTNHTNNMLTKTSNMQRSRIRSNVQVAKIQQKIIDSEKNAQADSSNLKVHKENFINLLRKVKNRGQSLFIKLNAFPIKGEIKNDK